MLLVEVGRLLVLFATRIGGPASSYKSYALFFGEIANLDAAGAQVCLWFLDGIDSE